MWKFQCKKHLAVITAAFVIGAVAFGFFGYQKEFITEILVGQMKMPELTKIAYLPYLMGGFAVAGAVNGFLLTMQFIQRYNINFIFVFILIFLGGISFIAPLGCLLLIPTVVVCIYGWLTMPNRGNHKAFAKNTVSSVAEVERVYRLHHKYLDGYEDMAKKIWDYNLRMNLLYAFGWVALFTMMVLVENLVILIMLFIIYAVLFLQLARRRALALQPVISLLYDDCNPEACASAIFALARKGRKKKNFPLPQHLAQCMIYLNDPHLAVDILVTCQRNKTNIMFPYYSLMAYAYYQLGDSSMVKLQYDECFKNSARMNTGPMSVLKDQCLQGIQNKLDLMDKSFDSARTFFDGTISTISYEFQKVDYHYYLGLISFVEKDLYDADKHFTYVHDHGGSMYFVEKANKFLKMMAEAPSED